ALYQLAKRGIKATGIEQHVSPNERSGHAGAHRVLHPLPDSPEGSPDHQILENIMPAWKQFQSETKSNIILATGVMMFGYEEDENFQQLTVNARKRDGDDRNVLSASQMREKYPLLRTPDDALGDIDVLCGAVRSATAVF